MKSILGLVIGSLISVNALSQTGKIVDADTGQPISYVHIQLLNTTFGTITNDLGEYEWRGKPSDTVLITHVAYETRKMLISGKGLTILLKPHIKILSEVIVRDFAGSLMTRAYDATIRNLQVKNYGKAFYRQVTHNDGIPTEIQEVFYTIESDNSGVLRNRIDEARYAVKKKKDSTKITTRMKNASYLVLASRATSQASPEKKEILVPFMPEATNHYVFTMIDEYREDEDKIVKMKFEPREDVTKPAASGEVILNATSLTILNLTMVINNSLGMDTVKSVKKKWVTLNPVHKITFDFSKNGELNYIRYNNSFNFFDNGVNHDVQVEAFLFVYENQAKVNNKLKEADMKSNDIALILQKKYNSKFWRNNPIVKRTPLQEEITAQFEKDGAFGTMFSKK